MPSKKAIIYHNPRCSKSRQTLKIIEEKGISFSIIKYLETPPDSATIKAIIGMLNLNDARDLMRRHESEYTDNNLDEQSLTQDELINAMVKHPKLIERPIVINGQKAIIGRPPESVITII